jgi:hypothetical protein
MVNLDLKINLDKKDIDIDIDLGGIRIRGDGTCPGSIVELKINGQWHEIENAESIVIELAPDNCATATIKLICADNFENEQTTD